MFRHFSSSFFKQPVSGLMSKISKMSYSTLKVTSPSNFVSHVEFNRPDKRNAMNDAMWKEIKSCFEDLANKEDCRVIVLSGAGDRCFTAGIDLKEISGIDFRGEEDVARKAKILRNFIKTYQDCLTSLEKCPKPVIAAVHGACIGGGLNLLCATDIRYCSQDAWFQNKEVDLGMAADVGTLQRMPRIVGSGSLVNELAFTCRKLSAQEAKECGLVSGVFDSKESLLKGAFEVANTIAAKSPVAVQGTKRSLLFSRDYGVEAGLEHIVMHNMAMLQSEDVMKAVVGQITKEESTFSKL